VKSAWRLVTDQPAHRSAKAPGSAKQPGAKVARQTLHLGEITVKRSGVHCSLASRDRSKPSRSWARPSTVSSRPGSRTADGVHGAGASIAARWPRRRLSGPGWAAHESWMWMVMIISRGPQPKARPAATMLNSTSLI
jgi:hypothetical protein